ncbi:hypothetical protein DFH09DRAFT_1401969 [Mycena vulgaris]|nr:hypothetical protein DFH09DRAFT_1401969 [Mycena vulgaris]
MDGSDSLKNYWKNLRSYTGTYGLQERDKNSKAPGKPVKKKKCRARSDASDSDDEIPAEKGKESPAEVLHELEQKIAAHLAVSGGNMSLWSLLISQGVHKSKSDPPPQLDLPTKNGSQAAASSRRAQQQQHHHASYPYPYFPPEPYPPGPYPPYPQAYYPPPSPPLPTHIPDPPPPQNSPARAPKRQLLKAESIKSDDNDDSNLYPVIEEWLRELDSCPRRGVDGHNFSQYGPALRANGFVRLIQLADEGEGGADLLTRVCEGMKIGTGRLLMRYAEKDCKMIRKIEKQRQEEWAADD